MSTRAPPLLDAIAADLDRAGAGLVAKRPADRIKQRRQIHRGIECVIAASHLLDGAVLAAPGRE